MKKKVFTIQKIVIHFSNIFFCFVLFLKRGNKNYSFPPKRIELTTVASTVTRHDCIYTTKAVNRLSIKNTFVGYICIRGNTLFLFPRSGNQKKRGVEFHYSLRNIAKIRQSVENAISLQQVPSAYPALCRINHEPVSLRHDGPALLCSGTQQGRRANINNKNRQ